jgi:hypothetical protein
MMHVIPRSGSRKVNGYVSGGQLAAAQRLLAMITQAAVSDGTANRG